MLFTQAPVSEPSAVEKMNNPQSHFSICDPLLQSARLAPAVSLISGQYWAVLRCALVSVDSRHPWRLALRVHLRLISRAAPQAAWVPSLGQTFHFPLFVACYPPSFIRFPPSSAFHAAGVQNM